MLIKAITSETSDWIMHAMEHDIMQRQQQNIRNTSSVSISACREERFDIADSHRHVQLP